MTVAEKAYDEMVDLFARGSDPNAILSFRPSSRAQRRVRHLLAQSKSGMIILPSILRVNTDASARRRESTKPR